MHRGEAASDGNAEMKVIVKEIARPNAAIQVIEAVVDEDIGRVLAAKLDWSSAPASCPVLQNLPTASVPGDATITARCPCCLCLLLLPPF